MSENEQKSKFLMGEWSIEWRNEDEIIVKGPYEQAFIICVLFKIS